MISDWVFVNLFHNFFYSQILWLSPYKEGFSPGNMTRSKKQTNKKYKAQSSNKPTQQSWHQLYFWILNDFSEYMKFTGFIPPSSSVTVNSWVMIFICLLSLGRDLKEWGKVTGTPWEYLLPSEIMLISEFKMQPVCHTFCCKQRQGWGW